MKKAFLQGSLEPCYQPFVTSCNPNPDGGQVWDATYLELLEETIFVDASKFFLSVDWRAIRGWGSVCQYYG